MQFHMLKQSLIAIVAICVTVIIFPTSVVAFSIVPTTTTSSTLKNTPLFMARSLHGQNACFLPIKQLDEETWTPRIIQIAGSYPGITREEYFAVSSEPQPDAGQWTYDFSDPDGPQLGTIALAGSPIVAFCDDPIVIIAEHTSLDLPFPEAITEPVDLVLLIDRSLKGFAERKFLVLDVNGQIEIGAFPAKSDLPENGEIIGEMILCQVPWLPCMKRTKSGFEEDDELY